MLSVEFLHFQATKLLLKMNDKTGGGGGDNHTTQTILIPT